MQEKTLLNFITVHNIFPWRCTIMYIDSMDFLADEYFIQNQVPVHFKATFQHKEEIFTFVFCSFNRKYKRQIAECMARLDLQLTLNYKNDYLDFKEKMNKEFDNGFEIARPC